MRSTRSRLGWMPLSVEEPKRIVQAHPLTRENAVSIRGACLTLPDSTAYTAPTMLFVIENYIRVLDELERARDALILSRAGMTNG